MENSSELGKFSPHCRRGRRASCCTAVWSHLAAPGTEAAHLGSSREHGTSSAFAPGQDANLFVFPGHPVGPLPLPSGFQLLSITHSQPKLHCQVLTPSPWPLTSPGPIYCFYSGALPPLSLPFQSYLSVLLFLAIFSSPSLATLIHPTRFYFGPYLSYCFLPPLSLGSLLLAAHLLGHSFPLSTPGSVLSNGKPEGH